MLRWMNELLVISNHPPEKWSDEQRARWDSIDYIPFPNVPAEIGMEEVIELAIPIIGQIREWKTTHSDGNVSIQGEFSLASHLITTMEREYGWCLTFPTSERRVVEEVKDGKTVKKSVYHFVRWR